MSRIALAIVVLFLTSVSHAQQVGLDADPTCRAALVSVARPDGSDDASWQREIASHATMLAHDATLAAALANDKSPIRSTKWFGAQPDAAAARQWLRTHLHAEPVPHTRLIRVYVDDRIEPATEEAAVLDAIVNSYITEQAKIAQAAVADRAAALNGLKSKYEIRVRELGDRVNNLMLRLNIVEAGSPNAYSTVELELREALKHKDEEQAAVKAAYAKQDAIKAQANMPNKDAALAEAEIGVRQADARLAVLLDHVQELRGVLGDLSIAMNDYHATQTEVAATRDELRALRSQLERLQSAANSATVQWAQHPVTDK
jgi:hypothetical protein